MILLFIIAVTIPYTKTTSGTDKIELAAGQYLVRCYGAHGGGGHGDDDLRSSGGKGAYVYGTMTINGTKKLFYINVGGKGTNSSKKGPNPGGSNGGGKGAKDTGVAWDGDDASGGGGGATDLRVNDNSTESRIIVAAGGSGGANKCNGAPGGDLKGRVPYKNNKYKESNLVDQSNGNKNGQVSDGTESSFTPESGGGGGWRGGVINVEKTSNMDSTSWKAVSHSSSSFISGYTGCEKKAIYFTGGHMEIDKKENDGSIYITANFVCPSTCSSCTSKTVCTECFDGYVLQGTTCKKSCDNGYIAINKKCEKCTSPCSSCVDNKQKCTSCIKNYYLYGNECRLDCPDGFAGVDGVCKLCTYNCETCKSSTSN